MIASMDEMPEHHNILELFAAAKLGDDGFLPVAAPMVRYSKLEFRRLLRRHGLKLCFTPMIVADSFNQSQDARLNEFTTGHDDRPLIAQFAAKTPEDFVNAAELIYPYVDGVDLNCGCPQSWAIAKGYGCALLKDPQRLHDMVRLMRRRLPEHFSCSLKIRLLSENVHSTVELARQMEKCGITFLTVHGRTQWQKTSHELNVAAMADIQRSLHIPLVVNGNVRSRSDAHKLHAETGAAGVMAARGLLSNPALFDRTYETLDAITPLRCVQNWLDIAHTADKNISFQCFHHHLAFMWSKQITRRLRSRFNNFTRKDAIWNFLEEHCNLRPTRMDNNDRQQPMQYTNCTYTHLSRVDIATTLPDEKIWSADNAGRYFMDMKNEYNLEECALFDL